MSDAQRYLTDKLEPIELETYSADGTSDIITRNLPVGTALYAVPPAAEQPDTVAVPRELYTCIGKGGKYELVGKSQGAGELKHQQLLVYRSTETGLLYHRTPDDFHARMALLAGGEQ